SNLRRAALRHSSSRLDGSHLTNDPELLSSRDLGRDFRWKCDFEGCSLSSMGTSFNQPLQVPPLFVGQSEIRYPHAISNESFNARGGRECGDPKWEPAKDDPVNPERTQAGGGLLP